MIAPNPKSFALPKKGTQELSNIYTGYIAAVFMLSVSE
jgi:hypothetical protein